MGKFRKLIDGTSLQLNNKTALSLISTGFSWIIEKNTALSLISAGFGDRLKRQLANVSDYVAGHIRFPDPVAYYPNVIQSVHLLGIHEKHHFNIVREYDYV